METLVMLERRTNIIKYIAYHSIIFYYEKKKKKEQISYVYCFFMKSELESEQS
jgi:hypothetical protein